MHLSCSLCNHKDLSKFTVLAHNGVELSFLKGIRIRTTNSVKVGFKKKKKKSTESTSAFFTKNLLFPTLIPNLYCRSDRHQSKISLMGTIRKQTSLKGRSVQSEYKETPMAVNKMNGFGLLLKCDISARIL